MQNFGKKVLDYEYTMQLCEQLCALGATVQVIGQSVKGRDLPVLKLGRGKRKILYLCSTHATETVAGAVLLRFAYDLLNCREICNIRCAHALYKTQLHILPLLNPDGAEIALGRIDPADQARLCFFNDGKDFTHWQANDRGVDLNHNFDADFARGKAMERELDICGPSSTRYGGKYPFSESETAALRDYILAEDIDVLYAFHTQGEEIYHAGPNSLTMARILAKACGYAVSMPEGIASCRGAKDWFCAALNRPGFTIEMGKGQNPLPVSDAVGIYRKCKEMLMLTTIIS